MGKKMDESNVHYVHVRINEGGFGFMAKESLRPVGTLAIRNDKDGNVTVALAMCHPKDNFCYKTGRHKAFGRLFSKDDRFRKSMSVQELKNASGGKLSLFLWSDLLTPLSRCMRNADITNNPEARLQTTFRKSLLCIAEDIEKGLK